MGNAPPATKGDYLQESWERRANSNIGPLSRPFNRPEIRESVHFTRCSTTKHTNHPKAATCEKTETLGTEKYERRERTVKERPRDLFRVFRVFRGYLPSFFCPQSFCLTLSSADEIKTAASAEERRDGALFRCPCLVTLLIRGRLVWKTPRYFGLSQCVDYCLTTNDTNHPARPSFRSAATKREPRNTRNTRNRTINNASSPPPGSSRWSDDFALRASAVVCRPRRVRAPTRRALVAVERMILHFARRRVSNHCLHRDELGGGLSIGSSLVSAKSWPPPR
jgi:hypothetical protein